ncbi:MAG: MBL fold metallo-hydrolase [Myxococcota bacterium]
MQRKWLLGCGALTVLGLAVLAVPVGLIGSAFMGNVAVEPGHEMANGRVTTVFDAYVACFLVDVGGGRFVLVDACMDEMAGPVRKALEAKGATLDAVEMIVLTHGHSDHTGATVAAPKIPVRAMAAELPQLEGKAAYRGPLPSLMGAVDSHIRVESPLSDGEVFTVGDTQFEVFALPGHTAGSAAILVDGLLFVGDSAGWKTSGKLVPAPWVFTDDLDQNTASLRALAKRLEPRAAEIEWIVPAHTGPAKGLGPLASF